MGKPYFLPLLIFLVCGHASAQVAVGGTSENADKVYWLAWDNSVLQESPSNWNNENLVAGRYVWYYADDVKIIAQVKPSNSGQVLDVEKYTPGEYSGDALRHMYIGDTIAGFKNVPNGVPFSGLYNSVYGGTTVPFDIAITLQFKIDEEWESTDFPGMVIADAEQLDGKNNGLDEYIQASTNATGWQLIDKWEGNSENYQLEFQEKQITFRATKTNTESQAVLFAKGATALEKVTMKGTGRSALALGFVLPFDVSEAERYCEARHYIDDFVFSTEDFGTGTEKLDKLDVAPLNPIPSLYIGSSDNPLDHGSLDQEELEVNFKQDVIEISVPVTNLKGDPATLYWWMDFNNDGIFAADEVKVFDDIAAGEENKTVTLEFSKADFSEGYNHLGENLTVGPLHARFRITTTPLVDNPDTALQDERSCGLAKDGEVEDYTFNVKGISISGTVFIDGNGMSDNEVNGTGKGELTWNDEASKAQLYAYLIEPDGSIAGKTEVDAEGTYNITNMNHGDYLLFISQQNITANAVDLDNLNSQLPSTWYAVGETFGDTNAFNSSLADVIDLQVGIKTPAAGYDIKEVDFGVDQPPFLTNDTKSIAAYEYVEVDVQHNDTDPQGKGTMVPSSLKLVDAAGNVFEGDKLVTGEGTFGITGTNISFQPFNSFHGKTASIRYVLEDQAGLQSEPALLTIEVGRPRMIISNPRLPHRAKLAE